jgi:hypothetical protein
MERISGSIFIRPNLTGAAGGGVLGHTHNFGHTTFFTKGWHLVRAVLPDGTEIIRQFCSPEYRAMRELQRHYQPEKIKTVYRLPDLQDQDFPGRVRFNLVFRLPWEMPPAGAVEIPFAPVGNHALIKAEVLHEIVGLSDDAEFLCVYSHRTPQGDVTEEVTGFYEGYV